MPRKTKNTKTRKTSTRAVKKTNIKPKKTKKTVKKIPVKAMAIPTVSSKPKKSRIKLNESVVISLVEKYGGVKQEDGKYDLNGFKLTVTTHRIMVRPKHALVNIHYDKTYSTTTGYDFIKVVKGTPEEDVIYLLEYLNNAVSPKMKKENIKSKKKKKKNLNPKAAYCEGCTITESEDGYCESMSIDDYTGCLYCKEVEFWNTWYCTNGRRVPLNGKEKYFPYSGRYMCVVTKEICPYNYSVVGNSYSMKGHSICPNFKRGRCQTCQ